MMRYSLRGAVVAGLLVTSVLYAQPARACACCSDPGQRVEGSSALAPYEKSELEKVRFAKKTHVYSNAAWPNNVKGITDPSDTYELTQTRARDRWTFSFKDANGKSGTLSFTLPAQLDSFFADLHDGKPGTDPALYKEWRLEAPLAGTGIFAGIGAATVRLVLQGRGNACTSADQFTSYTIVVKGPSAGFTLFGALGTPAP